MIKKKRQREKLMNMADNYRKNNNINTSNKNKNKKNTHKNNNINNNYYYNTDISLDLEENTVQEEETKKEEPINVREIPGFYYDYEKNRYFPLKNNNMTYFSEYINQNNQNIIKNKNIKQEKDEKYEQQKIINAKKEKPKSVSLFNMIKNLKTNINFKKEMQKNEKFKSLVLNYNKNNINLLEIKKKSTFCMYEIMKIQKYEFLLTFDHSDYENEFIFENIKIIKEYNNYITKLEPYSKFKFEFSDKIFESFKIIENYLILVKATELFLIDIESLLNPSSNQIIYYNDFKNNLQKMKNLPMTFKWPIIKKINYRNSTKKNYYVLLYYRSNK
jgi:hypothetical protein